MGGECPQCFADNELLFECAVCGDKMCRDCVVDHWCLPEEE